MGGLEQLRERRDALREEVDALAKKKKRRQASRPKDESEAYTVGQELLTGALPLGFLAGFLGSLVFGFFILMNAGPSVPAMVGQQGARVLEGEGVVVRSGDASLLARPFRVSVDPAGDDCSYAIVIEDGPRYEGATSCAAPLFQCGDDCVERRLQVDGIDETTYVRIDEGSGEVEVRAGADGDRWVGAFALSARGEAP